MSERQGKFCDFCNQLAQGTCRLCQRDYCDEAHGSALAVHVTLLKNAGVVFGSTGLPVCMECRIAHPGGLVDGSVMQRLVELLATMLSARLTERRLTQRTP
jgi:hypothetical protein